MDLGREDVLVAQNELLTLQIEILSAQLKATQLGSVQQPVINCEFGVGMPQREDVYAQVGMNLEENAQLNDMENTPWDSSHLHPDTYHPHHINHPNLSYHSDHYPIPSQPCYQQSPQSQFPYQDQPQNFNQPFFSQYETFYQPTHPYQDPINSHPQFQNHQNSQLTNTSIHTNPSNPSNLENILTSFMKETLSLFKNQDESIRNLENQIGQISKQLAEPQPYPSDTIAHPEEQYNSMVIKSRKALGSEEETYKEEKSVEDNKDELKPTEVVDQGQVSCNISAIFKHPHKTLQCMNIIALDSVVSASLEDDDSILKTLISKTQLLSEHEKESQKEFDELGTLAASKPYKLHVELHDPP